MRNKNLQNFQKMQMEQKRLKAEEEFMSNQEDAYRTKSNLLTFINFTVMLQTEIDDYLRYAEEIVKEYYNAGKDIKPLILDLKNYKKKMLYD